MEDMTFYIVDPVVRMIYSIEGKWQTKVMATKVAIPC